MKFEDAGPYVCIATQGNAFVKSGVKLTVIKGIFIFNFVLLFCVSFFIISGDLPMVRFLDLLDEILVPFL